MNKAVQQYLKEIGKKGGEATTPAKKRASQKNGKLGGRPKKIVK
jgi:general stress protein YciG